MTPKVLTHPAMAEVYRAEVEALREQNIQLRRELVESQILGTRLGLALGDCLKFRFSCDATQAETQMIRERAAAQELFDATGLGKRRRSA